MSNIDFLPSCSTNVRVVDDFFPPIFSRWETPSNDVTLVHTAISAFRTARILCAPGHQNDIWIFGDPHELEAMKLLSPPQWNCTVLPNSAGSAGMLSQPESVKYVKAALLDAVQGALSFALAEKQGMLHLGDWTWLFSPRRENEYESEIEREAICISLQATINDNGSLYIATTTEPSDLVPMQKSKDSRRKLPTGTPVILAPSSHRAETASDDAAAAFYNLPPQLVPSWKDNIAKALKAEGINLSSAEHLTAIDLSGGKGKACVLWPTRLCLTLPPTKADAQNWKRYFANAHNAGTSGEEFQNPLAAAAEMFLAAWEQNSSRNQHTATEDHPTSQSVMIAETPLTTSSPFNQRTIDQQAAMSGIYPTPPDGLIAAAQSSNATAEEAALQAESSTELSQTFPDSDEHGHSFGSLGAQGGYQPSSDDLFGDMDPIEFGANAVADEDFDYFDDPDEDVVAGNGVVEDDMDEDVEMMGSAEAKIEEGGGEDDAGADPDAMQEMIWTSPADASLQDPDSSVHSNAIDSNRNNGLDVLTEPLAQPEKPLSPFRIRERLLPPPIPASASTRPTSQLRRTSTFDPVRFNEGLDLTSKYLHYANTTPAVDRSMISQKSAGPDISLPVKRKKPRLQRPRTADSNATRDESGSEESEDDSYEDSSSMSDEENLPPKLPWDTKKRKRGSSVADLVSPVYEAVGGVSDEGFFSPEMTSKWLANLAPGKGWGEMPGISTEELKGGLRKKAALETATPRVPKVEELYELTKMDLLYVAQVISEHATSTTGRSNAAGLGGRQTGNATPDNLTAALQDLIGSALRYVLPDTSDANLSKLALIKEPLTRTTSNPAATPAPQTPLSRQRDSGAVMSGPDYFPVVAPYVRVQRGAADTWEMLPPALSFWTALGLGPANGAKDVRAVAVIPSAWDLAGLVEEFLLDLGRVYEAYKLGSFGFGDTKWMENMQGLEGEHFEGGMLRVGVQPSASLAQVFKYWANVCEELGTALAQVGHRDPEKTIVVYMLDPFEEYTHDRHHLCTAFWLMCKAYRDRAPRAYRDKPRSDLVLEIVPVSLLAAPDGVVLPSPQLMGALALSIYDRCPPSEKIVASIDGTASLPILAAPAVELAPIQPKGRILFQHSIEPPAHLIHEGSILHVAYAINSHWLSFCCMDNTGRYQRTSSTSTRGRSEKDVYLELWEKTLELLAAREVMWRVFITAANRDISKGVLNCWRTIISSKPRKQALHVTLLSIERSPPLQLVPPETVDGVNPASQMAAQNAAFLTPASTPQGTTISVSPDASGGMGQNTAPPTPAPSDTATAATLAENDPDAHLVDLIDESWGVLLSSSYPAPASSGETTARGLLIRRGESNAYLDALGVRVHFDVRMKPNGAMDEIPQKQAEAHFREILKCFRHLALLTKVKGLDGEEKEDSKDALLPLHVHCAIRAAEALQGFY